ncbi:hypothetical protein HYU40_01535 [Candidatus Woesearchaeota archaeon]|nr:hypothetical protein [Candidatus Woesearchaeota archaeon]
MDFLKAKKGQKKEEFESQANFEQLPPLPTENELYSELPNLPEAPETSGFPEIELPPPLKGLGGFDFLPEGTGTKPPHESSEIQPAIKHDQYIPNVEPLIPAWPKAEEPKLPDLPAMPESPEGKSWENVPAEVPELQMQIGSSRLHIPHSGIAPEAEPKPGLGGSLISHKNSFFLKSDDFRTVKNDIEDIIRIQKKHHKLTDIKKEENAQFEHMSIIIEDAQRKLMHLDRTLFE